MQVFAASFMLSYPRCGRDDHCHKDCHVPPTIKCNQCEATGHNSNVHYVSTYHR